MNIMRDTLHTLKHFGKAKEPKQTTTPEPSEPSTTKVHHEQTNLTTKPSVTEELLACMTVEQSDDVIRMHITIPKNLKNRFHTRCAADGHTMSGLVNLWIKRYLTTMIVLFVLSPIFATEKASFTTGELIAFVDKPNSLPLDLTVGTKARTGYGIGESMEGTELQPDLYAGLYAKFDIISTSEIRNRKETGRTRQAEVLHNLSDILAQEQLLTFLQSQKTAYLGRKSIMETRIEKGFSEQGDIIPIEQHLITIETKLQEARASVRDSQLAVAVLAGEKWKELYSAVQKWNRKL